MRISVISTVKNEGDNLRNLLDSLIYQTLVPHEVVISDGGSTDGTLEILEEYKSYLPLVIINCPGSNISAGRNRAIDAATGHIIAATDAGVVLDPRWVESITKPIREGQGSVVSGWFEPDAFTDFEVVMGSTVLPDREDINAESFLPSSRSIAFTKDAWQIVGGYPEWLDYCEDLIFDFNLRERFGSFPFAPRAVAYFRPRGSMRAYAKQYFYYSRGDGKADLWRKRHLIRYLAYLVGLPLLILGIAKEHTVSWLFLVVGGVAYCWRPFQRLARVTGGWRLPARIWAFALVPVIRFVGDVSKMLGYPLGVLWRLQNR